jgi:hypothetical protein
LGNLLIIDELGPAYPPDDAVGGEIRFDFAQPVEMLVVDHMDNEGAEDYLIKVSHICYSLGLSGTV